MYMKLGSEDFWKKNYSDPFDPVHPDLPKEPIAKSTIIKWSIISSVGLFFTVVLVIVVLTVKHATDSIARATSRQTQLLNDISGTRENGGFGGIAKVEAASENPLDKSKSYVNPFDEEKNPFDQTSP